MSSSETATPLAKVRKSGLSDHVVNVLRLMIKELRSIRADPTMLVLVVYAFSFSVNTVATGAVTEATNLSVGIVDEDGSDLSRQIAEALVPPTFQRAVQIRATEIDSQLDKGNLILVAEIPPNFEADLRARRKPKCRLMSMRRRSHRRETLQATSSPPFPRRSRISCLPEAPKALRSTSLSL
jgi:ABC-2 type transport system permease protein